MYQPPGRPVRDLLDQDLARHLEGIPTGFKVIDQHTGGLLPGALWVVLATPSSGRTVFATQLALQAARVARVETALHLGRESDQGVMLNLYSQLARGGVDALQRNELDDDDRQRLTRARNTLEALPLTISRPMPPAVVERPADYELNLPGGGGRVVIVDDIDDYFWLYGADENRLLVDRLRWLRACNMTSTCVVTMPEERWLDGTAVDPDLRREADVILRLVRPDLLGELERLGEIELRLLHNRTGRAVTEWAVLQTHYRRIAELAPGWTEEETNSEVRAASEPET